MLKSSVLCMSLIMLTTASVGYANDPGPQRPPNPTAPVGPTAPTQSSTVPLSTEDFNVKFSNFNPEAKALTTSELIALLQNNFGGFDDSTGLHTRILSGRLGVGPIEILFAKKSGDNKLYYLWKWPESTLGPNDPINPNNSRADCAVDPYHKLVKIVPSLINQSTSRVQGFRAIDLDNEKVWSDCPGGILTAPREVLSGIKAYRLFDKRSGLLIGVNIRINSIGDYTLFHNRMAEQN